MVLVAVLTFRPCLVYQNRLMIWLPSPGVHVVAESGSCGIGLVAIQDTDRRLQQELFYVTSFDCCNYHEKNNVIDALTQNHRHYFAM